VHNVYKRDVEAIAHALDVGGFDAPLVGIDGPGGSGKSTLARELTARLDGSMVEADDFYRPEDERKPDRWIGGEYDWRRLESQLLAPLSEGRPARYQRYDWPRDRLGEWCDLRPDRPVVVEGIYVLREELAGYYDYRVWVEAARDVRLRRGLERDGGQARDRWAAWMRQEDAYVASHGPRERADWRVDGNGPGRTDGG
jgi:uridine kinase